MEEDKSEQQSVPSIHQSKPRSDWADIASDEGPLLGLEPGESIAPISEDKDLGIEIVTSIKEDSNYASSEMDDVNDADLEDIVNEEDDDKSSVHGLIADETSILEKFITKRSPNKWDNPCLIIEPAASNKNEEEKQDNGTILGTDNTKPDQWIVPISKVIVWPSGFTNEK